MASRNRSAEARERGRVMRSFELSAEADQAIEDVRRYYRITGEIPGCTRVQALERVLRDAGKKIRKKRASGLDPD
jgi:hypothetical protein